MIHIVNNQGAVFHVRVVLEGEGYGVDDKIIHVGEPLVQFFAVDVHTEIHGPRGYLVSYYFLSTLMDTANGVLLDSHAGPHSTISNDNVIQATDYANQRVAERLAKT